MAELGAFFGNPNIQRQGARARALAGQRDVNTLADPRTYAIVQGLLGTAPDQMGLSVLNPDYEKIRKAAEPAFALGLLGQAAPLLAPMTKGLPVGASIKNVGTKLRVKPPTDDVYEVMDATFDFGKLGGNKTLPIDQLTGGVRMTDPKEVKRVKELAEKISSPDGYISRIVVDDLGNVLEGQHRFEALKLLGEKNVPVTVIEDLSNKYDIPAMRKALEGKFRSDEVRQLLKHSIDTLEEAGSIDKALSDFAMPARYQKPFEDAIKASKVKVAPRQEALDKAQRNAALPVEEGLLSVQKEQPMQGLLESKIPSPSSLTMPDVPTMEQMQKYGRVEVVPLSQAVSFQSARNWDKFNKGEYSGDLVKGFGDKPLALRLENGEYIIYDGNHRTDLAMQAGKTELPMNVIDVKSYDPAHAGRKPVPPSMSDDELLRSLLE
jgi:hypothetical protein